MERKIQKWGNSLAVRIPIEIARESRIAEGASVDVAVDDGKIVITPAPKLSPGHSLDRLVRGISPENRHGEVDFGGAAGFEAW